MNCYPVFTIQSTQMRATHREPTVVLQVRHNPPNRRAILPVSAAAVLILLPGISASASDWPQWLGPDRNGRSVESGLLKSWPAGGPKEVWRVEGGEGFSGMTISGKRAFTMVARGDSEFAIAMDATTGKELWRFRTDANFQEHQGGNGPRSTPAVVDGRLFALSAQGKFYALDAETGQPIWQHDFVQELGGRMPRWGFCSSPMIEEDLVLAEPGGRGHAVAAFRQDDGHLVWASQSDKASYSSPTVLETNGVRQAVFFTAEGPLAVAPATGQLLWRYPWQTPHDVNAATPFLVPPDGLFISSGYDRGAALLKLRPGGGGADLVWEDRTMKNHMATSVLLNGHIYGFDNGTLKCIVAANGKQLWQHRGLGKGTLILADGQLLILSERGELVIADASPTAYLEKGRLQLLGQPCWTAPSLAGGLLYVRDEKQIVCIDLRSSG